MSNLGQTLGELSEALAKAGVAFVLTRFNSHKLEPDDIDVLVKADSFHYAVQEITKYGYTSFSHDQALGGRIAGAQVNLVKQNRIKIDLHQDFTWRRTRYFDLSLVWDRLEEREIGGVKVKVPKSDVDAFIVAVNIIFEKTYLTKEDWQYLQEKNFDAPAFRAQAQKYGWQGSYNRFIHWWQDTGVRAKNFPVFLPLTLVLYSYSEKFKPVSLVYYFFFRTRYLINKRLPYD